MTFAHITLLGLSCLLAVEAGWALLSPLAMRKRVRRMLDEAQGQTRSWPVLFWLCAVLMWAIAWHGQTWAHRLLFFAGVFFLLSGWWACRTAFIEAWYRFFLGNRSPAGIRLLYFLEWLLAAALSVVALNGW